MLKSARENNKIDRWAVQQTCCTAHLLLDNCITERGVLNRTTYKNCHIKSLLYNFTYSRSSDQIDKRNDNIYYDTVYGSD